MNVRWYLFRTLSNFWEQHLFFSEILLLFSKHIDQNSKKETFLAELNFVCVCVCLFLLTFFYFFLRHHQHELDNSVPKRSQFILFIFFILLNYCLNSKGQKGENTYPAIANFFLMEYFYYRLWPVILDKFIL